MAGAWGSHGVRSRCNLSKRVGVKEAMDGGVVIGESSVALHGGVRRE